MTSVGDKIPWKAVEVNEHVVTEDTGFFGLEVLDGSTVDVIKEGGVWKMKTKQKTKKRKMPTVTEKNKGTAGKILEATGGLPEGSSSTLVSTPAAAAASVDPNSKKKKASDRRKAKRKKKKILSRKEREDKQSMDVGDLVGTESTEFVPFADPWCHLGLDERIGRRLQSLQFFQPTPIQATCIPKAILGRRDKMAAARTGSGKTLAFGLPIVHLIAEKKIQEASKSKVVGQMAPFCLILSPTRELALQIDKHLVPVASAVGVSIATIVGGISEQKQDRLLSQKPDIVVATPGRLWNYISLGNEFLSNLHLLQFFVLDEADRMIEKGHYEEVDQIVQKIINPPTTRDVEDNEVDDLEVIEKKRREVLRQSKRQTMLFSATLAIGSSGRITVSKKRVKKRKLNGKRVGTEDELKKLMERVGLRGKPLIVNLATDAGEDHKMTGDPKKSASSEAGKKDGKLTLQYGLMLKRINCTVEEKEVYLYVFCHYRPGRTLVFANTIEVVRRVTEILKLLRINVHPLHAQMQQKQRLKNLERFRNETNVVLVATDVAARGIDVPGVDHVLHYNIPRNVESFIHRSGRTARASASGLSVILASPLVHEVQNLNRIVHILGLTKDRMPELGMKMTIIKRATTRVKLARQIFIADTKVRRSKSKEDWLLTAAQEMDMIVDEDLLEGSRRNGQRSSGEEKIYRRTKIELNNMLNCKL